MVEVDHECDMVDSPQTDSIGSLTSGYEDKLCLVSSFGFKI